MLFARKYFLKDQQGLIARIVIWAIAEIILNYAGIDDLADYSEFLFEKPVAMISQSYDIG